MAKDTVLKEDAEIYKQRAERVSEKEKFKDMGRKEKIQYFNDYYRNKTLVAIILAGATISLLYTILAPKNEVALSAAIVNDYLEEESINQLTEDFAKYAGIDTADKDISIDSSYFLSEEASAASIASAQRLSTYVFANYIDVIITDESQFQQFVENGYFENLSDQLPTDLYSSLSDFFYIIKEPVENTMNAYGIYLDHSKAYQSTGTVIEKPVIGIVSGAKQKRNCVEFIRYLFD